MYSIRIRAAWIGVFVAGLLLVGACDVPTSGPSFETDTGLNSPVVVDKTFTLLGGPASQYEPLVDTTTSQFDSLFTVAGSGSLSIEEEVSSFDVGSLDQALDEATAGVGANTSVSEPVIQGSGLATQDVNVDPIREENGKAGPIPAPDPASTPVANTTLPFPDRLLAVPDTKLAFIQADTVRQGTLTSENSVGGTTVNQFTFTLYNASTNPTPLTENGGTSGPTIRIEDSAGTLVASADFADPIQAGESKSSTVSMAGKSFGKESQLNLVVEGSDSDPDDELTVELSALRYQKATLEDNLQLDLTATRTGLSTRGGGTQFAGVEARSGTLQLEVTNNFRFPIQIERLQLENNLQNASALPDSFPTLDALGTSGTIDPGAQETIEIDLTDQGIAQSVDVEVKAGLPDNHDLNALTAAASDNIKVSTTGSLTIGAMYFWPQGEEVQASGTFDVEQDRISFDKPGDYVELDAGTLSLDNVVSEPTVAFESVTLAFPDIRKNGDALTVPFSLPAEGTPQIADTDLSDFQLSPTNNSLAYDLQGTLETIPASNQNADNLRVIRYEDAVQTDISVNQLDVRALEAGIVPFSVEVTEDANGDGELNISDLQEATQESFSGFQDLSDQVDGLQLTGSELNLRVTTNVGTDAQLYAALQGRGDSSPVFLAGRQEKKVSSDAPLGDKLVDGGTPIGNENLIQFGVEGVPPTESLEDPVTPSSITLTDANSTVDAFISALPNALRFVAQARMTGKEVAGRERNEIRLRRPLEFDAGLSVAVPVQVDGSFTVEDTMDADFSDLEEVTDPTKDVTVSSAELRVKYENGIPLGADATLLVHGEEVSGQPVITLPGGEEQLRLKPVPKAKNGTASGTRTGTTTLSLSEDELRDLAAGRRLRVRITMDQADDGKAATLRASDTIDLSLEANVNASVEVN